MEVIHSHRKSCSCPLQCCSRPTIPLPGASKACPGPSAARVLTWGMLQHWDSHSLLTVWRGLLWFTKSVDMALSYTLREAETCYTVNRTCRKDACFRPGRRICSTLTDKLRVNSPKLWHSESGGHGNTQKKAQFDFSLSERSDLNTVSIIFKSKQHIHIMWIFSAGGIMMRLTGT